MAEETKFLAFARKQFFLPVVKFLTPDSNLMIENALGGDFFALHLPDLFSTSSQMKYCFLLLFSLSFIINLKAQITGSVSTAGGEGIAFANVLLLTQDSVMVNGVTTDLDGNFLLPLPPAGPYLLRASAIGYVDGYTSFLDVSEESQDLAAGRIELAAGAIELATLEIKARKLQLEQLPEGTIVNVQSSILTRGSSALQVLERSPGVFIDRYNNSISLNGRAGVTVLLNGKTLRLPLDALLATLGGMSADNIQKIELLTSPGAKYDAEGSAGVINIVLKQNEEEGTQGSLSLNTGYGYRPKAGGSLQFSRGGALTRWNANYAYNYDQATDGYHGVGSNNIPVLGGAVGFDVRNNVVHRKSNHQLGLGLERQLNERVMIGLGVLASQSEDQNVVLNQADYNLTQDSAFNARINIVGRNRWRNINPNIFLETTSAAGDKLQLNVNYLFFSNDNPTLINNSFLDASGAPFETGEGVFSRNNKGTSTTDIHIFTLQADYTKVLREGLGLAAGIKASRSNTENSGWISRLENGEWQRDERTDGEISANETIVGTYASMNMHLGEKNRLTMAARYEFWEQQFDGAVADRRSGRFFPSLSFSHQATDQRQWQFSYSRRINRPTYNDLASALTYSGLASVFSGNPLLQPTLSNQLRVGYAFGGKLIAASWQRENGAIARFQATANAASELIVVGPQNIELLDNLDLQLTVPFSFTKWWSAQLNAISSWRNFSLTYTPEVISHRYLNISLNGNQTFTLPKKWTVELSGWYNSGDYNGSVELKSFGALSLGVKKELPGKWGSLQFVAEDLIKTSGIRFHYGALGKEHYDISAIGLYLPESARHRIFRISYFRNFGEPDNERSARRGAEEERNRVRL